MCVAHCCCYVLMVGVGVEFVVRCSYLVFLCVASVSCCCVLLLSSGGLGCLLCGGVG